MTGHSARPCSLDRCVERQQVGLFGDVADDVEGAADLFALDGQLVDLTVGVGQIFALTGDYLGGSFDQPRAVVDGLQNSPRRFRR